MALLFPESVPSGLVWKHLQCVLNNSRLRDDSFLTRTLFLFWVRLPFVVDAPCALEGVEQPPWPLSTDAPSSPVLTTKKKKKKTHFQIQPDVSIHHLCFESILAFKARALFSSRAGGFRRCVCRPRAGPALRWGGQGVAGFFPKLRP